MRRAGRRTRLRYGASSGLTYVPPVALDYDMGTAGTPVTGTYDMGTAGTASTGTHDMGVAP